MHTTLPCPIGRGFVVELKDRYIARWNAYVLDAESGEKKKVTHGPHELGRKVSHGPGLKNLKQAKDEWDKTRPLVFAEKYPRNTASSTPKRQKLLAAMETMSVSQFITSQYEPDRELEDNSRKNWEYIRDAFILPAFGTMTLAEMNDKELIRAFVNDMSDRNFSWWTCKKALSDVRAILKHADAEGVIRGNQAMLVKLPKKCKRPIAQPAVTVEQFRALMSHMKNGRDRILLRLLFLCAVRRSELFTFKWGDLRKESNGHVLTVQRSFCSATHKVKEWEGKQANTGKTPPVVAVPPQLTADLLSWAQVGDTEAGDPEAYIFPTRKGTPIIPTNWSEDVLKPAGVKAGVPGISYHWFRRGHATVQHFDNQSDKAIQGQLRHAKVETTQNIYMQHVSAETHKAVAALEASVV